MPGQGWASGWVAGVIILGACSREIRAPQGSPARAGAAEGTPSASALPARDGASAPAATAPPPIDEGSPAQSIALPDASPVTIRPVGPAAIEVTVGESATATWKAIEVERRAPSTEVRQSDKFERTTPRGLGTPPPRRHLHAAKPGTAYVYRARAGGAWSDEITVRTPAPKGPPPVPASVMAQAATPFAVRVAWEADARSAAGFAIEVHSNGSYVRAALVDPTVREFVHHRRLPGHAYAYRIRAFNRLGVSAPSEVATVTTSARAESLAGAKPPPCARLPKALDPAKVNGISRDVLNAEGGHPLYNDPEGNNALRRHLYGEYEGCMRDFGAFTLQADVTEVPGFLDEGFPLLHAVAGAGQYVGAQILTLRFARGRYTVVDSAYFCGDPWPDPDPKDPAVGTEGAGDDLTTYAPPFETCQRE